MTWTELEPYVEFVEGERIRRSMAGGRSCIVAIGHFGNFELYARFGHIAPGIQCATTYRSLKQPRLNQLLQDLRERSGCLYFERRLDGDELRTTMSRQNLLMGLLADQNGGDRGLRKMFRAETTVDYYDRENTDAGGSSGT